MPVLTDVKVEGERETPLGQIVTHQPVVSCADAARARRVSPSAELKTLIMYTPRGFVAVHLRGTSRLSLELVRGSLDCGDVRLATVSELTDLGLRRGCINPWNVPFCVRHLVSMSIFTERLIATNVGCLTRGIIFSPLSLLKLVPMTLGRFEDGS